MHTDVHAGVFPTGGWGEDWMGDPDKGFGTNQPGGWIYNVLPYLEQQNLRSLGAGSQEPAKSEALVKVMQKPLEIFNCPSRRLPRAYPYHGPTVVKNIKVISLPESVAKTDYAINGLLSYEKSEVLLAEIQLGNGLSNTLLAGEKSVAIGDYVNGSGAGDGLCMYMGDSDDIRRTASGSPQSDVAGRTGFGGPHPGGCNIVYCDGAIRFLLEDESFGE
jgi:prepilin-type processing-associated H-X9-DG protein